MSRHLVREGARSYECGGPGTVACCAECAGHDLVAALRAELATLQERYNCNTAIMHARTKSLTSATRELAETKAALDEAHKLLHDGVNVVMDLEEILAWTGRIKDWLRRMEVSADDRWGVFYWYSGRSKYCPEDYPSLQAAQRAVQQHPKASTLSHLYRFDLLPVPEETT